MKLSNHMKDKSIRDSVPNTMSTFSRKKYQKLAPGKPPGVPLPRYSVRFFNSAPWASNTKNLLALAPRRYTEIFLMGQYRKPQQQMEQPHQIHSGASGPGNKQCTVIKMTSNIRRHYPRHDMSLPLSLLVKGIRGKVWMGFGD